MSTESLYHSLLRPAILQIVRAAGFHSAKNSVIDALTDIAGRYITLLASQTAFHANSSHNDNSPDVTDIRLALADCGLLTPSITATQEVWRELLRQPLSEIPERNGLRRFEEAKRDEEDTEDITEFVKWFDSAVNKEIKRIAGQMPDPKKTIITEATPEIVDYLTVLKKKHSKMGEESKFQGTVLGIGSDFKSTKIEGGPESLNQWLREIKRQKLTSPSEDLEMAG